MNAADGVVLVIDTNVVLDLFVYQDPATAALHDVLADPMTHWLATPVMREELRRVLAYPQLVKRLALRSLGAEAVLEAFDARVRPQHIASKAPCVCKDADDQKFVDLAVAHTAVLLSKDKAVLSMKKRLDRLGVRVAQQWPPSH
jgi:putative PIN family toxin of toxin-antitoxin system